MRKSFAVMRKGDYGNRTAKRRDVQKPVQKVMQKKCANAETGAEGNAEDRADDCAENSQRCRNGLQKWVAETVQMLVQSSVQW